MAHKSASSRLFRVGINNCQGVGVTALSAHKYDIALRNNPGIKAGGTLCCLRPHRRQVWRALLVSSAENSLGV